MAVSVYLDGKGKCNMAVSPPFIKGEHIHVHTVCVGRGVFVLRIC